MLRIRRLLAVVHYEVRCHMSGRPVLRLLGVAAALLLPAGMLPTPRLRPDVPATPGISIPQPAASAGDPFLMGPPPPPKIRVRGTVPPALASRLEAARRAPYEVRGEAPVIVTASAISKELRTALETLDGPVRLEVRDYVIPGRLPGRSLLIALLAISLLTGPLADALPGERARRTLEVLLTAGISRAELVGGKWLAWTMFATSTATVSAALAVWRGVQAPGWWLVGLPLFIASTVAVGLWLVRLVDDVVGGSAAPMRVLPAAAGAMAAVAYGVEQLLSPVAAAAVPLGGPLLLAANLLTSGTQALVATAGTAAFVALVLTRTGSDLDRVDMSSAPSRWGAIGLSGVATLLWWLTVAGPGVWNSGGTTDLVTPMPRSMMVGGMALLACALIAIARETHAAVARVSASAEAAARARPPSLALPALVTLAVAAALAASGPLPDLDPAAANPTVGTMLDRLREGALPTAMAASAGAAVAAFVSMLGQAVLFRSVIAKRSGAPLASLLWCVAMCPFTPWSVLAGSFALGALAAEYGWAAAFAAHVLWALAASAGSGADGAAAAIGFQMIALLIALSMPKLVRGVPRRHQL